MPRGGTRTNAGRKPGAATRRTREIAEKAASAGVMPVDVQLATMRAIWSQATSQGKVVDLKLARDACDVAAQVAPYVHPRLAAVETRTDNSRGDLPVAVTDQVMTPEEWERKFGQRH